MKENSLLKSTGVVVLGTLLSRILGFVRDMITAHYFGASGRLDGFFIAFRIPNLLRRLVAEGAFTVSFIPVYTEYLVNRGEGEALKLAQKVFSLLLLFVLFLVVLGVTFSPGIVRLFAWGFTDPAKISLTVDLNRIMFPYLFFVSMVAFAMGVLNSRGYFFTSAFSPVLLNCGIIAGAVLLGRLFAEPLYGLAAGVLIGGLMQMLLQVPSLGRCGFRVRISMDWKHPGVRKVFRLVAPGLLGIAVYQINILMSTVLASMLAPGSISYIYYSDRINEIVLGIFIVSIGNVILPRFSRYTALESYDRLRELYLKSARAALFLALPAGMALMAVGLPIVSLFFMRGEFTPYHAQMTYKALLYSSMGMASLALLRITTPLFYSLKDTKTPVAAAGVSFALNIVLGFLLMGTGLRHGGLCLANSIAATVQVIILLAVLHGRLGTIGLRGLLAPVIKYLFSGVVMVLLVTGIASRVDWLRDPFSTRLVFLLLIVASGSAAYFLCCLMTGVEEIRYLYERARGFAGKK